MHFGSFRFARFMKKFLGAFLRFIRPKAKLFSVKFRRILEILCLQGLQIKFWAHCHDLCVQNEAVSCEVQTHFGSFHLARFIRKVPGALSRFLRPIMKLFAAKFRRILEVLYLQGLQ